MGGGRWRFIFLGILSLASVFIEIISTLWILTSTYITCISYVRPTLFKEIWIVPKTLLALFELSNASRKQDTGTKKISRYFFIILVRDASKRNDITYYRSYMKANCTWQLTTQEQINVRDRATLFCGPLLPLKANVKFTLLSNNKRV
jgi:hypothetical protein